MKNPSQAIQLTRPAKPSGSRINIGWQLMEQSNNAVPLKGNIVKLAVSTIVLVFATLASGLVAAQNKQDSVRTVFSCDFQRDSDKNLDRQPDNWRRRHDRAHPSFIEAEIRTRNPAELKDVKTTEANLSKLYNAWKNRKWDPAYIPEATPPVIAKFVDRSLLNSCYQVEVNGGAYELVSQPFDIDSRFDYLLSGELACQALKFHSATIELHVFDGKKSKIGEYSTTAVQGTRNFQLVSSQQITLPSQGRFQGEIRLRVQPRGSSFGRGIAQFDNIRLLRIPTLTIESSSASNILTPNTTIDFTCKTAGLNSAHAQVELTVSDIDNQLVHRQVKDIIDSQTNAPPIGKFVDSTSRSSPSDSHSTTTFQVPFTHPGIYKVGAKIGLSQKSLLVAVLDQAGSAGGSFGLSMQQIPRLEEVEKTVNLITACQVGWVKIPIWYDEQDRATARTTSKLAKGLRANAINVIGRLDRPPASQYSLFEEDPARTLSVVHLHDPNIWSPLLEPVLTDINTSINGIQLGSDEDTGYMSNPNAQSVADGVRTVLKYYFQNPSIAIGWNWLEPLPEEQTNVNVTPWNTIQFATADELTGDELQAYSANLQKQKNNCWTLVNPLPASKYSLHERVIDLLERMIAVKQSTLQAAFLSKPFNAEQGVFDEQGKIVEILVPWTQIASAIGNRTSLGSIELPNESRNVSFQGQDQDVMILWNSRAVVEELYFGANVVAKDIWARPVPVEVVQLTDGSSVQRIAVGKWPIFVYGIESNVIRWRQEFQVLVDHLSSHLSGSVTLPLRLQNTLPTRVSGSLSLSNPQLLKSGAAVKQIELDAGRVEKLTLPLELRSDASAGEHLLEFNFQLKADKDYAFTVRRKIILGDRDIEFQWQLTRLDQETVEARVELVNRTGSAIDFDCTLFPPDQPYLRFTMTKCQVGSTIATHQLRILLKRTSAELPNQQIWIRCQQLRSPLTLNYLVTEKPLD
jgi:hypothetical protein